MTAQEHILTCCLSKQYIFNDLIKMGMNIGMFAKSNQDLFLSIVEYRDDHRADEVLVTAFTDDNKQRNQLLDWSLETDTFLYSQYYEQFEKEYIQREQKEILRGLMGTRDSCLEVAVKLTSLAESGSVEEDDLGAIIESTLALIAERQSPNYSNKYGFGKDYYKFSKLGNYEPGTLVTLGGGSGHGKTTFALNLALKWLKQGLSVIYFSNEMEAKILMAKLVCIDTGLHWRELMNSSGDVLTFEGYGIAQEALMGYKGMSLRVYTKEHTIPEMSLIIKTYKPDVFILDTINALIKTEERTDIALGEIARSMSYLAKETDSLAICVAQLKNIFGRPTDKDDIKESRQIRDASDYMDFVYREHEKNPNSAHSELKDIFEIYRVKGRLVGIGSCYLHFDASSGKIESLDSKREKVIVEYFDKNNRKLFGG